MLPRMFPGGSKSYSRWLAVGACAVIALLAMLFPACNQQPATDPAARLAHLGKSHLEQGNPKAALPVFEQALALNPTHPDAQLNLALALLQAGENEKAIQQAQVVLNKDRSSAAAWYITGLAQLHLGRFEPAVQALTQAKNIDVTISPVQFQLGLAYEAWGKLDVAISEWQTLVQFEPDHPAAHYRLSQALRRMGKTKEAEAELDQHRQVLAKRSGPGANMATLEQCKYTQVRVPFRLEPPDVTGAKVVFTDVTKEAFGDASKFSGPLGVIDFAQDGRNHLLVRESNSAFRLLLNAKGVFKPQGNPWPSAPGAKYTRCLVGDLNNDGAPDALFLGDKGVKLLKLTTNGTATDATAFAGLKNVSAIEGALVDLDFRGSLDLIAVNPGGQGVRVLRNLGNMYFSDQTTNSGVPAALTSVRQVALEDWNNDNIQDMLIARAGQPPLLLTKLRGGPLTETNSPKNWPVGDLIAVGDLNNDLKPDLVVAGPSKLEILFTEIKLRTSLPLDGLQPALLQLIDYDNDGWLDIVAAGNGLKIWRNLGPAGFRDVTSALGLDTLGRDKIDSLVAADFDNDGDTDLIVSSEKFGLRFLRNDGGNANLQLKVLLAGRRSNASGLGIHLEVSAGGLRVARHVQSQPVEIGVGRHAQLDAVQAHWFNTSPTFVDVKVDPRAPLRLEELVIQEGSCPYLYAWDGGRFRFVTDILGCAPLGLPVAEGRYVEADADELAWIGNDTNFKPRNGDYVLQITEELREVLYLDEAKLVVVDHAPGIEIHTTHKLLPGKPYPKPGIVTLCNRRPLRHAARSAASGAGVPPATVQTTVPVAEPPTSGTLAGTMADGTFAPLAREDLTAVLSEMDSRFASPPAVRPSHLRGLAEPHGYILDFGPLDTTRPLVLALTGWLRLGGGMANIAASHQPGLPFPFPQLEVETSAGAWKAVDVMVGAPSGKTKTILVDLTGKLPPQAKRLRLTAAFELHWDRIALFEKAEASTTKLSILAPASAHLHWRGFSELAELPWNHPLTPVYERAKPAPVFTLLPGGWCTRYGDVMELIAARDNALALINGGDELTLRFPASALPAPPPGTVRDFFLDTSGWDKDSDFHVRLGTSVGPLPWHGLDDQLYGQQPRPAFTNDAWMQRFNTRWVGPHFLSRKK